MVRKYKRKKNATDKDSLQKAVRAVLSNKSSVRAAARQFKVPRSTLKGWVKKHKNSNWDSSGPNDLLHIHHGGITVSIITMFTFQLHFLLMIRVLVFLSK